MPVRGSVRRLSEPSGTGRRPVLRFCRVNRQRSASMRRIGHISATRRVSLLALAIAFASISLGRLLAFPLGTTGPASSGGQGVTEAARPAGQEVRRGEIHFLPDPNEATAVPRSFQLEARTFAFEESPLPAISDNVRIASLTFPSPVHTPQEKNNTVYCEYYRPAHWASIRPASCCTSWAVILHSREHSARAEPIATWRLCSSSCRITARGAIPIRLPA